MPEVTKEDGLVDLSIMLPAYNEQEAISQVINEIRDFLQNSSFCWQEFLEK